MYYNVFGEKVSRRRFKEMCEAARNRRELIAAGLANRRDLLKMGLLTAGGMLVAKSGLSARAAQTQTVTRKPPSPGSDGSSPGTNQNCVPSNQAASPPTQPFCQPLPIMPVASPVPLSSLSPEPTNAPNTAAGEVRAFAHQGPTNYPNVFPNANQLSRYYRFTQEQFLHQFSPGPNGLKDFIWGFNDGDPSHGPTSPGPTYIAKYGVPQMTRNINLLPTPNNGFGNPSVTTHLHNAHNPSESDGNPCDFYTNGHFCDQYYPNVLAGFSTDPRFQGDPNEAMSTLWYHDHRVDFTSQNVYKGLAGFYLLFNGFDTGDETTGFHLPGFKQGFDIPLMFADRVFNSDGTLHFDLFNLDGILGDKFLVNGVIQPFFVVSPRRYRFRLLNTGPSRFYEFFLTGNVAAASPLPPPTLPFWLISTDGNLLPDPVPISDPKVTPVRGVRIGVAERVDIIIDFSQFAGQTLYLENRLNQINGQGPVAVDSQLHPDDDPSNECAVTLSGGAPTIKAAGGGDLILQFQVTGPVVTDNSVDPATNPHFYDLPSTTVTPNAFRTFKFERLNGQWSINGQFMDCSLDSTGQITTRFTVKQNTAEKWFLTNLTGDWTHPVHIHLEEHQILSRNRGKTPLAPTDKGRKDVDNLHPNERVELFFRFRDWLHKYPLHCHNVVHEDHAMMLQWKIEPDGDTKMVP